MWKNPSELAAVIASKITVFAIEGLGHDPLRATGALLLDLPRVIKRMDTRRPQVFWLRPRNPEPSLNEEHALRRVRSLAVDTATTWMFHGATEHL